MKINYEALFVGALLIVSLVFTGIQMAPAYNKFMEKKITPSGDFEDVKDCRSDDLMMTSECLRKQIMQFFKFNITNIDLYRSGKAIWQEKIDWDVIKEQGGVCWHYARWYYDRAKELNLSATLPYIKNNETTAHMVAIISDDDEYCLLDQINKPSCYKVYSGGENE